MWNVWILLKLKNMVPFGNEIGNFGNESGRYSNNYLKINANYATILYAVLHNIVIMLAFITRFPHLVHNSALNCEFQWVNNFFFLHTSQVHWAFTRLRALDQAKELEVGS